MTNYIDRFKYYEDKARLTLPLLYIKSFFYRLMKKKKPLIKNDIDQLLDLSEKFDRIVVVASGPSSSKIDFDKRSLYITTNSSYRLLPRDVSFVHMINDSAYVKKFLTFGLKYTPLKTYIYCQFENKSNYGYGIMRLVKRFLYDENTEIISQDQNLKDQEDPSKNICNHLREMNRGFRVKNPLGNSGLMILNLGLLISGKTGKPIYLYGLDAGEGGRVYADGRRITHNHVAMREKNKEYIIEFITFLSQEVDGFNNQTYIEV